MSPADDALARYRDLIDEVDRAFAAIQRNHASEIRCGAGCHACCRARLSVCHVEAASLRRGLASLPQAVRRTMSRQARQPGREYCPGLDAKGRCQLYAFRPLACRTIGVPVLHESREPLIQASALDVCDENFHGVRTRDLKARGFINQTDLDRRLAAIDARYRETTDRPSHERVPLAQIFTDAVDEE